MRPRLRLLALLILGLSLVFAGLALAGVPSASNSDVQAQLLLCPYDAIPFAVVVRDAGNNPVASSTVQMSFTNCAADPAYPGTTPTHLCPTSGPLTLVSGTDGRVQFMLKAGGVCPGAQAIIRADGVIIALRTVASPDQDGNLVVESRDGTILVTKQTTPGFDPTADLDGDGSTISDGDDIGVYTAHLGHACDAVTPVGPRTWGSLKIRYR